jgi:hypothetical protein
MSIFMYPDEEEAQGKLNIDDLYEKKQKRDLKQLSIFNKIIGRIHKKILFTARNKTLENFVWFNVPAYIVGEPIYDKGECIGYIVSQLEKNGFHVKYIHPNTLFISWHNHVPSYVRNEIKKKTGLVLDEKGNIIEKMDENYEDNLNTPLINQMNATQKESKDSKESKQYNSIKNYKPTGNLIYSNDMFEKIEKKVNFAPNT